MKPKDLKSGFCWENRTPQIKDGVLYVPEYYFSHESFQMPQLSAIFNNSNPVAVEYCSGHGHWIIEQAKAFPYVNWIAVEKQFERVRKIFSKRANAQLENLLIVCGEAETFTQYYLQTACLDKIYVNFPDPWPKQRHAKHRLMKPSFIKDLARVINKQGTAMIVTDDEPTSQRVIDLMLDSAAWQSSYPHPYFVKDLEDYGYSFFKDLWETKGKEIFYMQFQEGIAT